MKVGRNGVSDGVFVPDSVHGCSLNRVHNGVEQSFASSSNRQLSLESQFVGCINDISTVQSGSSVYCI